MEIFASSFLYAGGPLLIVCVLLGWLPYFCFTNQWNDAKFQDPIRSGLQSSIYSHTLIAGIAASFPSCLELIFYLIFSRGNSVKRTILILANMIIFMSPEIISFLIVLPTSNSKLYYLLLNNRISTSMFLAMLLLCRFSEWSWRCKLSTLTVSFIYVGSLFNILAPYSAGLTGLRLQNLGPLLQLIGCIIFIIQSYKFLCPNSVSKESEDRMIVDDLLCKFITLSVLFVIIGLFSVYLGAGLPHWTEWNSTYISSYSLILAVPNMIIGLAFAHATRNETVFLRQVKQMFVNYISHEMRTPLNTAVMGLQCLRDEIIKVDGNDEIINILDEVRGACEISVTILSEMLDFDKLQSGLMKMEFEEVNVKDYLETTISPFYLQANAKGITLQCNLYDSSLSNLLASFDKSKFAQVIRNLLSNALKFTPPGGVVTVTASVSSCLLLPCNAVASTRLSPSQEQLLTIQVTDSGAGISKENQKKLFKEMVQFNPGKLQSGGGSGLGLYISKGIMDLLNGTLSMTSDGEGHGCCFTVTLHAKYDSINVELVEIQENNSIMIAPAEATSNRNKSNNCNDSNSIHEPLPNPVDDSSPADSSLSLMRADSAPTLHHSSSKVAPLLLRSDSARSTVAPSPLTSQRPRFDSFDSHNTRKSDCSLQFKVLVVDDSTSNRKMLTRLLRDRCAVIDEAVDGVDAVQVVRAALRDDEQRRYDAILLDYIMPNMEGPEAAREIRELGYVGLIVGITGNVLMSDKEKFLSNGADMVLTKPININDIDAAFKRITTATFIVPHK